LYFVSSFVSPEFYVSAWVRSGSIAAAQSSASAASTSAALTGDELLESYRHVEVASVSDALEQLTGRRMYMSHKMQSIFPAKFAGYALTVKLAKDEGNKDPEALSGMLAAIDEGSAKSVWVMVVEDGANIAGMGGLMGTTMSARGYAGAVIDGGVRDVGTCARSASPFTQLGSCRRLPCATTVLPERTFRCNVMVLRCIPGYCHGRR